MKKLVTTFLLAFLVVINGHTVRVMSCTATASGGSKFSTYCINQVPLTPSQDKALMYPDGNKAANIPAPTVESANADCKYYDPYIFQFCLQYYNHNGMR